MKIIKYSTKNHRKVIAECVAAMRVGKVVVYPTDTSYGIACDPRNQKALRKLYRIKERKASQPVHVIPPSMNWVRSMVQWNATAADWEKLFCPDL